MFLALRTDRLPKQTTFTVTIGESTKISNATYYLSDPTEVFATIRMLNDCDETGDTQGRGLMQGDGSYRGSRLLPVPRSYLIL